MSLVILYDWWLDFHSISSSSQSESDSADLFVPLHSCDSCLHPGLCANARLHMCTHTINGKPL